MEKLTKTRIKQALKRKEIKDRHRRIQSMLWFDELEYNNYQFEYGMKFLKIAFEHDPPLAKEFQNQKTFCFWWIKEWNRWEAEYLEYVEDCQPVVDLKNWKDEMDSLVGDYRTHEGFKNYLKLFHNVRIQRTN